MGFKASLMDEVKFLLSGRGMPYEKVCIMVAMVISVALSVILSGNFGKDAPVAVIDLDNSRYSRELITKIDSSEYMKVTYQYTDESGSAFLSRSSCCGGLFA